MATDRRWIIGGAALAVSVVALLSAKPLITTLLVMATAPIAVVQLFLAARGPVTYEVHQNGIARTTRRGRSEWTWDQVAGLHETYTGGPSWLGWGFQCTVLFGDGTRIRFTDLTHDYRAMSSALVVNSAHAIGLPTTPPQWWRRARWLAPLVAVGCFVAFWEAVAFLLHHDEMTNINSPFRDLDHQRLPVVVVLGIGVLAVGCLIGVVSSLVVFARSLRRR